MVRSRRLPSCARCACSCAVARKTTSETRHVISKKIKSYLARRDLHFHLDHVYSKVSFMTTTANNPDRTVHAVTAAGHEVVRYERAGKWFLESNGSGGRQQLRVAVAAYAASRPDATWYVGRKGGEKFDALVAKEKSAQSSNTPAAPTQAIPAPVADSDLRAKRLSELRKLRQATVDYTVSVRRAKNPELDMDSERIKLATDYAYRHWNAHYPALASLLATDPTEPRW